MDNLPTSNQEIEILLGLLIKVQESLKGTGEVDNPWLNRAELFGVKMFYHAGSLYYLSKNTKLGKMAGHEIFFLDYSSIIIITRALLETYLTYHYIFNSSKDREEQKIRYDLWELDGLISRQKYVVMSEKSEKVQKVELEIIHKIRTSLNSNTKFLSIPEKNRVRALKGEQEGWRLGNSWTDLAVIAGFEEKHFRTLYKFLVSHAHTVSLSIYQFQQVTTPELREVMVKPMIDEAKIFISCFINDYVELFPAAKVALDKNPKEKQLMEIYRNIGHNLGRS